MTHVWKGIDQSILQSVKKNNPTNNQQGSLPNAWKNWLKNWNLSSTYTFIQASIAMTYNPVPLRTPIKIKLWISWYVFVQGVF